MDKKTSKMPSQRQLRVAEQIRHVLATVFREESFYELGLESMSLTVSEVRISPDLKQATVYVSCLGKGMDKDLLKILNHDYAPRLRHMVDQRLRLRNSPRLHFTSDDSFEEADKIESLLSSIKDND